MSEPILDSRSTASDYRAKAVPDGPASPGDDRAPGRRKSSRRFLLVGGSVIAGLVLGGAWLMMRPAPVVDELVIPAASGAAVAGQDAAAAPDQGNDPAAEGGADGTATVQEGAEDAAAPEDGAAQGSAEGAGAQTGDPVAAPRKSVKITSRDPFEPIVAKAPAASTKSDKAAKESKAAKKPVESAAAVPEVVSGATISALKISSSADSVTLKLDGKKYSVDEGETFAKSYRLYDIFNANCAGFLYGDQNAVVCEGDSVKMG